VQRLWHPRAAFNGAAGANAASSALFDTNIGCRGVRFSMLEVEAWN
jgi:hypothetical protein